MIKHKHQYDSELLNKRLLWLARTSNATRSAELGLDNAEDVKDADNSQSLMEKVGQVYVIDEPQDFYDAFSFLEELEGEDLNLDEVLAIGEIDSDKRAMVMQLLVGRMADLTSQNTWNKINAHQGETLDEYTDVTDSAKDVLDNLSNAAKNYDGTSDEKPDSESEYYKNLADVVETMGLKKDQLMRTNELTGRVKTLEQAKNLTQSRLGLLQSQINHVDALEKEAKETHAGWKSKLKTGISSLLGGGSLGFLGATGTVAATAAAGTTLSFLSLTGVGSALAGAMGVGLLIQKLSKEGIAGFNRLMMSNNNATSIALQKKLLKKGKVDLTDGQYIKEFKTPQPLKVQKDSIIDGRVVTDEDGAIAPRGSVVTGNVSEAVTISLPEVDLDGKILPATKENLEKIKADQQGKFDKVDKMLSAHTTEVSQMYTSFNTNYIALKTKITDAESIMSQMAQQRALAKMREEQGTDGASEEFEKAEKAFQEAEKVLGRAKEALKAMEKVKRVFGLNEKYAKQPVPAGVLKSIYEQTVNPEALDLMMKLQKQQTEKTRAAQDTLRNMDRKKMKELLSAIMGDIDINIIGDFVADAESLKGLSEEQVLARYPFLREIRTKHADIYKYFMAMTQVPPGTEDTRSGGFRKPEELIVDVYDEIMDEQEEEAEDDDEDDDSDTLPDPVILDPEDFTKQLLEKVTELSEKMDTMGRNVEENKKAIDLSTLASTLAADTATADDEE
jgi:hypothetical protein